MAQDVIIKTDKIEIKSKVTEITETAIKYKKWENMDGPVYSLSKTDVFMIVYANGQREIIKTNADTKQAAPPAVTPSATTTVQSSSLQSQLSAPAPSSRLAGVDTTVDYKSLKVKYKPSRINVSLQPPLSIGTNGEMRIIKNIFNIGLAYDYIFFDDPAISSANFGFVYGSLYAPLNRLTGNYEKQDKGLFVFAHAGYGYSYIQYSSSYGGVSSYGAGGFTWRLGADYFFSKGFGLTVSSYELKNVYAGIVFGL